MKATREVAFNKKALYDYEVVEKIESGIVLTGSEVKSMRLYKISLSDSHAAFGRDMGLYLFNVHIPEYKMATNMSHEAKRTRKLLLRKKQLKKLVGTLKRTGYTLIPLSIFFNERGWAKVSIAVAKGKKEYDKRELIKEREWNRDKARLLKNMKDD